MERQVLHAMIAQLCVFLLSMGPIVLFFFLSHLIDTSIMANMRYFPKSGTTSDVGGMISTTSRKKTYKLVRIEMDSVT